MDRCFLPNDEDIPFEEDILRNEYSVRHWLRYIEHKNESKLSSKEQVFMIYERALKSLPGSYKIWFKYLQFRHSLLAKKPIYDDSYEALNNTYERCLVFMNKMPRIWSDYCKFLNQQCLITRTRRTLDRSLQALPVTQHKKIWTIYIDFIKSHDIPETAIRVFKRFMKIQPEDAEDFINYLIHIQKYDDAAVKLAEIVNNENFNSKEGKSKHQLWSELCDLISKNPDKIHSLKVDPIIREGINRYKDEQSKLWNSLAEYYIRLGMFNKARDIYEEALSKVMTIRDFSQVFDAYAQSEEKITQQLLESDELETDEDEIDLRLARLEYLMERRSLLVNSVALRQNSHNVEEWLKRIELVKDDPIKVIETYSEAIQAIEPKLALGKLNKLWVNFAKFYEENGQLEEARTVFSKATEVDYVKVDDLAAVWSEYAEMELRHDNYEQAIRVLKRATALPSKKSADYFDSKESVQMRVHKSLKLWSMYADLEESFGSFNSTKAVYDRIIDLRIATPQIIINYALFLEENKYFEEAFKAYEKGVNVFKWPVVFDIWNTYLAKFLRRYGGIKLERARDLFEQCLEHCPSNYSRNIYFLYAKLEEDYGLAKHAMAIYERATHHVDEKDRFDVYNVYIKKTSEMFGLTYTRPIYEKAIENLPDSQALDMCIRFADLERKLGEIDRARSLYSHCSGFTNPLSKEGEHFWNTWKEFEIKHGNEDTIKEMLRIKRCVQATYNTQVNLSSKMIETHQQQAFVKGTMLEQNNDNVVKINNPDSIDID